MHNLRELVTETIDSMKYYIEAHDGFAELGEIEEMSVVIYYGGKCADCKTRCIDDAINERVPGIIIIPR